MIIKRHAFARAGLIGNPSDGYFGKTISVILHNFSAEVTCYESPRLNIEPCQQDQMHFDSLEHLADDVQTNGYYGGLRLIKASIKRFREHCIEADIPLDARNFTLEYRTDIPVRVGLAGSSGIVTATLRALMQFYGVDIPPHLLANLTLSVELQELGIGAGLQDRVVQAYEGVVFMDFDRSLMESRGYGDYEQLDPVSLPPLFVAYHDNLPEGSEITHNDLRSRFNRGDKQVHDAMEEFASYAQAVKDLLAAGRGDEIGPILSKNFALRKTVVDVSAGNQELVAVGERLGAHTKLAGSGGAVIGTYDGDPTRLQKIREAYELMGAQMIEVDVTGTGGSA